MIVHLHSKVLYHVFIAAIHINVYEFIIYINVYEFIIYINVYEFIIYINVYELIIFSDTVLLIILVSSIFVFFHPYTYLYLQACYLNVINSPCVWMAISWRRNN